MENEVKEPAPKYNYMSPEEYLEMERASEEKHEYYSGHVVLMSGASLKHNQIAGNLYGELYAFLKDKNCQVLPSEMRVSTPNHDTYLYPDALIVCNEPELQDDKFDTLINPSVVFEIISPSSEKNDAGYKFLFYQRIPSLKEYIMIDSRNRYVRTANKQPNNSWIFEDLVESNNQLVIQTIQFTLSFDDIYRNTGL